MPPVVRIVLLALAGGVLFDVLVPGNAAGINAPLLIAALLAAALLAAGRDGIRRLDPADAWLGPAALVLASMAAVRADDWLVTVDLVLATTLAAGMVGALAGGRVTRGLVPHVLDVALGAVAAAGIGAAGLVDVVREALPADGPHGPGRLRRMAQGLRGAAPVARGLLLALPVAAVFVVLFASADAVFARLASDLLAWQPDLDLEALATRTIVITVVAWVCAGLLALGAGLLPAFTPAGPGASRAGRTAASLGGTPLEAPADPSAGPLTPPRAPWNAAPVAGGPPGSPGAVAAAAWPRSAGTAWAPPDAWAPAPAAPRRPLRLGTVEAATILLAVDALFAAFVALQLAYLFGGRDTMALAGLTYAEYARRGFFDLVIVAVLAGALVVTLDLAVVRRSAVQLGGALLLVGLTVVVLVSAFLRLRLYQDAYGWTELRFVVLTAILWLGVALGAAAALLATRRTRWVLHVLGIMVLVTVAGMNVVGPQAFVADRNLERAIDPTLVPAGGRTGLDAGYLAELGDEAVVPIVAAWDRLGERDRLRLAAVLRTRGEALADDPALRGWPAWNLTRERARTALRAWEAAQGTASR